MGLAAEHVYRYSAPSVLDPKGRALRLATSSPTAEPHPRFFVGDLARPEETAKLLLSLTSVVQARFHVPASMLERILTESDPVVTCSDDRLRFEGFSSCCGAYARVDLDPGAVEGERFGRGTTNVDFNPPLLAALAMVRPADPVKLSVGREGVEVETAHGAIVERKIRLPLRWLRGFVEVQATQRRMQRVFEIPGAEAARFLRGLPRVKTSRRATWIVPSGRGLRLSQVEPRGPAVRVGGLERLRSLERIAPRAQALHVYADETTGATGWVLVLEDCRFQLFLSPEVWRGFSGEGQALEALSRTEWRGALDRVRAQLGWHAVVEPETLARRADVEPSTAHDALAALGARGLVGYDVHAGAYFHRELPFDLGAVEELQPRLLAARKLIEQGRVRIEGRRGDQVEAFVESKDAEHRVRLDGEQSRCSCPWYAKHQGDRGPCKHVLATQLLLESEDDGDR